MKMIKPSLFPVIFLGLIFTGIFVQKTLTEGKFPSVRPDSLDPVTVESLPITAKVQVGREIIELEVAATPEQQQQGLMYRTELAQNRGMLFSFNPPRVARFWMKNTMISLDMIFLRNGEIKAVFANVPPCRLDPCPTYGPSMEIDQVIELPAGRAQTLRLKVGDRLEIIPLNSSQIKPETIK